MVESRYVFGSYLGIRKIMRIMTELPSLLANPGRSRIFQREKWTGATRFPSLRRFQKELAAQVLLRPR
jgi:hypothetical protein